MYPMLHKASTDGDGEIEKDMVQLFSPSAGAWRQD